MLLALAFDENVCFQHQDICSIPSKMFYDNQLKTGVDQPSSVLRIGDKVAPFVFGHIEGTTVSLVVNTAKGNENSKTNKEERETVVSASAHLFAMAWCWCEG